MAVGQRQRLYSGVRMSTGNYLSSTPRKLRERGVELEWRLLIYIPAALIQGGGSGVSHTVHILTVP